MRMIVLPKNQIYHTHITGKFVAPDSQWQHLPLTLTDYELIVMTEGTLYMTYQNEKFTVHENEYLLLPPSRGLRGGFQKAYCSFYWMHFTTDQGDLPLTMEITPQKPLDNTAKSPTAPAPDVPSSKNLTARGSAPSSYAVSSLSDNSVAKIIAEEVRNAALIQKLDNERYFAIPQTAPLPKKTRTIVLMKQLQDIAKNNYPQISLDTMTTTIMTQLYGQLCSNTPSAKTSADKKQIYLDIIDYIQLNLSRNITIAEIADQFGYNSKYLSHLFAEIRGIPLKQFILSQKMDAANFMLTDNNNSISDIAASLGFSDVHNFSRTYKKITGLTPSEYRNAYAKRLLFHV